VFVDALLLRRLSQFAKTGGESYLFDALHVTVSESDKKVVIIVCTLTYLSMYGFLQQLKHAYTVYNKNQSTCISPCMVQTTLKRSGMDHTAFNL